MKETKIKLDNLEKEIKKADANSLAKEVDKKMEVFEKKLEHLVKAIEHKDIVIIELEKRLITVESQHTEQKKKLKDCETMIKKTQKQHENIREKFNKLDKSKDKTFKCNECDFSTTSQQGLKIHNRKKHTNAETSVFPVLCDLCERELRDERELRLHMNTHSYKEVQFRCEECDFCGNNEVSMEVHISKVHAVDLECGMCEYKTKDLETLELHLVTCEIYECKQCGKRFNTLSEIKNHMADKHKKQEYLKVLHAKLDVSNSEEIKLKTYFSKDLFPEIFSN